MDKMSVLKEQFGYTEFRPGQEELIDQILSGRDTLGVMPTGAGKSICYQLPALMAPGITLVVSPLISLMKDQVNALTQSGIPAAFINSSLTYPQYRRTLEQAGAGAFKLIYIAPERLETEGFASFAARAPIDMVTIDEAHCVSQWGHDFRPSYLRIADFVDGLEARPVVSAFTATATARVREDIIEKLALRSPYTLTTGFDRKNLYFGVEKPKDKLYALKAYLDQNPGKSGIVYCATRKTVEEVCEELTMMGVAATRYHAGLGDKERRENQDAFLYDQFQVMVATNAFGMGIDKSNVSFVIHYNMPKNLESYYQEAGRAGRDGSAAECILYYSGQDVITNQFLIDSSADNQELTDEEAERVRANDRELLKQMTFYCHTQDCLRGYILRYFGERADNFCGNCSNCNTSFEEADVTVDAQMILSCIARTHERFGAQMICDILRGSKKERIRQWRLDQQSTYGLLANSSASRVRDIITHLEMEGFLRTVGDEYPTLSLTPASRRILFDGEHLTMKLVTKREPEAKKKAQPALAEVDAGLFERLRTLRGKLARQADIPPYLIFTDAALRDMCARLPATPDEFLEVSGVGQAKLQKYGDLFLAEIRSWRA